MLFERSAAVLAAAGAAFLCAALACGPARADYYAFGSTAYPSSSVTLSLDVGGNWLPAIGTGGNQGEIETNSFSSSNLHGAYLAGVFNGSSYANYFVFNLPTVPVTVTAAKLTIFSGAINGNLDYSLFGATQAINTIQNGVGPRLALFNELGSGVKYSTAFAMGSGSSMQNLIITLNATAVADINAVIEGKSRKFAVAGMVTPSVPEASTWAMMLAGFAGLAFAAYRRAAKRRAALTAA